MDWRRICTSGANRTKIEVRVGDNHERLYSDSDRNEVRWLSTFQ